MGAIESKNEIKDISILLNDKNLINKCNNTKTDDEKYKCLENLLKQKPNLYNKYVKYRKEIGNCDEIKKIYDHSYLYSDPTSYGKDIHYTKCRCLARYAHNEDKCPSGYIPDKSRKNSGYPGVDNDCNVTTYCGGDTAFGEKDNYRKKCIRNVFPNDKTECCIGNADPKQCDPKYYNGSSACTPLISTFCSNIGKNDGTFKDCDPVCIKFMDDKMKSNEKSVYQPLVEAYCKINDNIMEKPICSTFCSKDLEECNKIKQEYCKQGYNFLKPRCIEFCKVKKNKPLCDDFMKAGCNDYKFKDRKLCSCYKSLKSFPGFEQTKADKQTLTHCFVKVCRDDGYTNSKQTDEFCPKCIQSIDLKGTDYLAKDFKQSCGQEIFNTTKPATTTTTPTTTTTTTTTPTPTKPATTTTNLQQVLALEQAQRI